MEEQKITPVDAFKNLVENFQYSDALWIIITIFLVFAVYGLSLIKIRKETTDWKDVAYWIIAVLGWCFGFFMFGLFEIKKSGMLGYFLLGLSFLLSITSIILLTQSHRDTQKIASSVIVGIVGFGMAFTSFISEMTLTYSLAFGFVLGLIIGRVKHAISNLQLGSASKKNKKGGDSDWDYSGTKSI